MTDPPPNDALAALLARDAARDLRAEIDAALAALLVEQGRIDTIGRHIVRHPAGELQAMSLLREAQAARSKLAQTLGLLLAEWRLSGGEIRTGVAEEAPKKTSSRPVVQRTEEDSDALKDSFLSGAPRSRLLVQDPSSAAWRLTLARILTAAGPPPNPRNEHTHDAELAVLERETDDPHLRVWLRLPLTVQKELLKLFIARARGLKDVATLRIDRRTQLKELMPRFPSYAASVRPGHVNGLRPEHRPQRTTWHEDAMVVWNELLAIVPEGGATTASEAEEEAEGESAAEEAPDAIPSDWKGFALTRGQHVVIVGGTLRDADRERLEETFGFADIELAPTDGRKIDALADRLEDSKVELLLMVQSVTPPRVIERLTEAARRRVPASVVASLETNAVREAVETIRQEMIPRRGRR